MLTVLFVSTNKDFVQLLGFVKGTIGNHCKAPVPLLADMNLYYRFYKLCFGQRWKDWKVGDGLKFCPPVYGV